MKINEKMSYVSPKVELVKVKVEKGFAPSDQEGWELNDQWNFGNDGGGAPSGI